MRDNPKTLLCHRRIHVFKNQIWRLATGERIGHHVWLFGGGPPFMCGLTWLTTRGRFRRLNQ